MVGAVSKKSISKFNPMKISVSRLAALFLTLCLPLMMVAKKSGHAESRYAIPLPISNAALITKVISATEQMYNDMGLADNGLSRTVFMMAVKGFSKLREKGLVGEDSVLTIIDFTKSSREKRLYVLDLKNEDIVYNTVVAHGKNSGQEYAKSFSNKPRSNKSSLGFYITEGTYLGGNGYSLKLNGAEAGINDKAFARAIVMHGADYANEEVIGRKGFLGRSFGCPAVPQKLTKKIIDKIKDGNALFVYFPDPIYLKRSNLLNG
jgi:L,D-transpeptidase catalytic domain